MRHWYKSAPMKGILLILEHILAVVAVMCMVFVLVYPGQEYGRKMKDLSKGDYKETRGFENYLKESAYNILGQLPWQENLETNGEYNPDKLVDIEEFFNKSTISGKNNSGLAYRLGDIADWSENFDSSEIGDQNIVVCLKEDGSYAYYTYEEFEEQMMKGTYQFADEDIDYLYDLEQGYASQEYEAEDKRKIVDKDKKTVYTDCWNLSGGIEELYKTVDGKTLLEIANENPKWNGRLAEAYRFLTDTLSSLNGRVNSYYEFKEQWTEGNTNLTYLFADFNSGKLYTNRAAYTDIQQAAKYVEEMEQEGKYVVMTPRLADFKTNLDINADSWNSRALLGTDNYLYAISVNTAYPIQDTFYVQNQLFNKYAPMVNTFIKVGLAAFLGFFVILIWLTCISGRTVEDRKVHLTWFDRIKTELALIIIGTAWVLAIAFVVAIVESWGMAYGEYGEYSFMNVMMEHMFMDDDWILFGFGILLCCLAFFIGYLSIIRRIKAKTLWKNSVVRWLICGIRKFLVHRSCTFKVAAGVLGFIIVHWIAIGTAGAGMILAFPVEGVAIYYMLRRAITNQKIREGIREIAEGNVDYQIPTYGLKGEELDTVVHINHIGEGLSKAVEKSMRDERLKTDLITNVSHDIKTPLTSIINYVDLLKRENIQDEKIQGYLNILEAKSQRLKTLTEDVVEASKISSGNITMEYMNINLVEMIHQTTGEFTEKFEKRNLNIVLNLPEHPVMIRSDGRRMWRVIENIYNNAAKYAMEGTRVYADLVEKPDTVEFSLKNVSEQPLNISADELTERFIRGDISRSTEGSGLGLSIAKNLTELQGGQFNLYLDGDLFKVTIIFPKVIEQSL